MYGAARDVYARELQEIRDAGLFKGERVLLTPQAAAIGVEQNGEAHAQLLDKALHHTSSLLVR